MTLFGIDASSAQGSVSWAVVAETCAFGFEKVTEATGYVNPYWRPGKTQLEAQRKLGKIVPGAYLFLKEGEGTAQADFFASHAGSLDNWLIVVDAEQSDHGKSNPTQADLNNVVSKLRWHYPHSKIGGYCPEWYWGSQPLVQFDYLWNSKYVTGSAGPLHLYTQVPSSWWNSYGNRPVELLQFTSEAQVRGVAGPCDCSAFRGTFEQLKQLTTNNTSPAPVPISEGESEVYVFDMPQHQAVVLPIPAGKTKVILYADPGASGGVQPSIRIGASAPWETKNFSPTWGAHGEFDLVKGQTVLTISRLDTGATPVTIDFV